MPDFRKAIQLPDFAYAVENTPLIYLAGEWKGACFLRSWMEEKTICR
jgi:hypothetical protein